jgi:two-component system alkaline phosphatase synthesis response regulator PhoP
MKKILLVDDDKFISRFVSFRLMKAGYAVYTADNGIDGLEFIKNLQPDLVILDMMMPGLDGKELLDILIAQQVFDPSKVIVLSGKEVTSEVKSLFDLGIHDYLTKPFRVEDLLIRIERALALQARSNG